MAVDNVNSSENQARVLAQKKRALEDEKNALEVAKAQAERDRLKQSTQAKTKIDKEIVEISKQGEKQAELVKKLNSDRVQSLNDTTQKEYNRIAENTANDIKRLDQDALSKIQNLRNDRLEKLTFFDQRAEDPFYRLKGLNPVVDESETNYTIKVKMADHEAQNLFVSGEGNQLKISLARRFQDQLKNAEAQSTTKTNSYQTIVETLNLSGGFDPKGIKRDYADGTLTITVPKNRPPIDLGPTEKFDQLFKKS